VKRIILLGGPNGAGKTTTARVLLPEFFDLYPFLNADDMRGISPQNVEAAALAAGRLLIEKMRLQIREGRSFALETTLSGKSFLPLLRSCKENGWTISLYYFWLPSLEHSIARVANRVRQGGHSIPDEVIFRRFRTGLWNMLHLYLPRADTAAIYDNSQRHRILIADQESGCPLVIHDHARWSRIEELTLWK
jgi:predicted ABC-type ATPase